MMKPSLWMNLACSLFLQVEEFCPPAGQPFPFQGELCKELASWFAGQEIHELITSHWVTGQHWYQKVRVSQVCNWIKGEGNVSIRFGFSCWNSQPSVKDLLCAPLCFLLLAGRPQINAPSPRNATNHKKNPSPIALPNSAGTMTTAHSARVNKQAH